MSDSSPADLRAIDRDIGRLQAMLEMVSRRVDGQPSELATVERRLEVRQDAAEGRQIEALARVERALTDSIGKLSKEIEGWHCASEKMWAELHATAKSSVERAAAADARLKAVEVEQSARPKEPGGWGRIERLVTIVVLLVAMTLFGGDGAARLFHFLKMLPVAP